MKSSCLLLAAFTPFLLILWIHKIWNACFPLLRLLDCFFYEPWSAAHGTVEFFSANDQNKILSFYFFCFCLEHKVELQHWKWVTWVVSFTIEFSAQWNPQDPQPPTSVLEVIVWACLLCVHRYRAIHLLPCRQKTPTEGTRRRLSKAQSA